MKRLIMILVIAFTAIVANAKEYKFEVSNNDWKTKVECIKKVIAQEDVVHYTLLTIKQGENKYLIVIIPRGN